MPALATTMLEGAADLLKRQYYSSCPSGYYRRGNYCYRSSRWNDWGRWVALAVIVVFFLLIAFFFSCINNRRRRRRGLAPMYGTGWVPGHQNVKPQESAPPYSAQPVNNQYTGNTFNSNEGYYGPQHGQGQQYGYAPNGNDNYGAGGYGGQQNGVELQQPQQSYQRGGENVYSPPAGPPPGKGNDGIIR